jgi:hypothetical protein
MRREAEAQMQAAGEPGAEDLETVLALTALAWPQGAPPAWAIQQEGRNFILKVQNWTPAQTWQFQQALRSQGWDANEQAGVMRLSRGGL